MKATLAFDLPEEKEEFHLASNAGKYEAVVDDIVEWLRRKLKYEELTDSERSVYQRTYEEVFRIKQEWGIGDE